jgi:D-3-phosphoglycerate dehydrogenase
MFRVLVTSQHVRQDDDEAIGYLRGAECDLSFSYYDPERPNRSVDELVAAAREADGILAGSDPWSAGVLQRLPRLRAISRYGIGYDRVDIDTATKLGIAVSNAPAGFGDAVAEFTVGLIIALSRHIVVVDRAARQRIWSPRIGHDVAGKTLGIIGFGAIGKRVATLLQNFRMRLLAYDVAFDHVAAGEIGVTQAVLADLLAEADFVTLHVPLFTTTVGLIGEPELRQMKSSALLINTSRGPVIDEDALVRALKEGWIAGAALDVFADEPYRDGPLLTFENVIVTPHMASYSREADRACRMLACKNLVELLRGERCRYVVNPDVYARLSSAPQ